MTVKELINKLSALEQNYGKDLEVLFRDHDYWYYDIGIVEVQAMNIDDGQQQKDTDNMPEFAILF